ncbi:MAG: hypothetical protein WCW25_01200 [Patescibacteria group bacterium]|jgi:hypothetical protein
MSIEGLREQSSERERGPLLDLELKDGTRIVFSEWENFNPQGSKETFFIPEEINRILNKRFIKQEKDWGSRQNYVFENTIEKKGWEDELYDFVRNFLNNKGKNIADAYAVDKLDGLSPRQLFGLSLGIVSKLTKYNDFEVYDSPRDLDNGQTILASQTDDSTALEVLRKGLENCENPDWIGTGVCRTFASSVKAVFNAIKACQSEDGAVKNSYCLYEVGTDYDVHLPARSEDELLHSWNLFLNIDNEQRVQICVPDVTWGTFDEKTGKAVDFDNTLPRIEPIVFELMEEEQATSDNLIKVIEYYGELLKKMLVERVVLKNAVEEKLDFKPGQIKEFFEDYDESKLIYKAENYEQLKKSPPFLSLPKKLKTKLTDLLEECEDYNFQRSHFLGRALTLVIQNNYYGPIPEGLISQINKIPGQLWENKYLEALWKLAKYNQDINISVILDSYIDRYSLFVSGKLHNPVDRLIFKDDELQTMVYEKIKNRQGFGYYSTWPGMKERLGRLLKKR